MVFNSFLFWLLFPLIFVGYWALPVRCQRLRRDYLLLVSYLLYLRWNPVFALVLIGVTLITYLGARIIGRRPMGDGQEARRRKAVTGAFITVGLLPLLVFKYYDFCCQTLASLLSACGLMCEPQPLGWAVPVGISFFTFQAVGYLFDVYHRRIEAERDVADYALFVCFFPQVTSGPISTARDLLPQLKALPPFRYEQGVEGLRLLLWGMFLKCVVADRLGLFVDTVFAHYLDYSGMNCLVASLFYTIQIYADFAGYSLMAIGIARTLGIALVQNFARPYFASSITAFWRRWHISLTRWLTTHVYINLGGSHCSRGRQYLNILVTFLVSGLWHGAGLSFVVWGLIHGIAQIAEKAVGLDPKGRLSSMPLVRRLQPLRVLTTLLVVSVAWVFFRMPTLADAWAILGHIVTDRTPQALLSGVENKNILYTIIAILTLVAVEVRAEFFPTRWMWLDSRWCRWVLCVVAFCAILCMGVLDASSFIYVSF